MRLVSVNIHNFRVIKQASIDFPDNVVGIIGPNGAGKSSIVEAISWALYGNTAARSGKDEIRSTFVRADDDCRVEVTFQVNGQTYRVVRCLVGKRMRAEVELYRGASSESVGSTETQKHIADLLGLDWRGFLTSFLARQQELNALSDLQPAKRREHLVGMLGIGRLDQALQRVKDDARLHREKATFIRNQLVQKDQVAERIEQLREHVIKVQVQVDTESGAHKQTEDILSRTSGRFEREQKAKAEAARVSALIASESRTTELLIEQLAGLTTELTTLRGHEKELAQLEIDLADYDQLKEQSEAARETKSKAEYVLQLKKQTGSLQSEFDQISKELIDSKSEMDSVDTRLAALPEKVKSLQKQAQNELDQARDDYSRARARKEVLSKEVSRARGQLDDIRQIGPGTVCDRCHRPFGSDLPQIREHLQRELQTLLDEESSLGNQLDRLKADGAARRSSFELLSRQATERQECTIKRESLDKMVADTARRKKSLQQQISQLSEKINEIGEADFDEIKYQAILERLAIFDQKRKHHAELSGSLSRLPNVESGIGQINQKLTAANAELEKLQTELGQIGFVQADFDQVASEFAVVQRKYDSQRTVLLERSKELELAKKELDLKKDQLEGFARAEAELEQSVSCQFYGEKLGGLFSDFRKHVIARIRPRLAELSTSLFSEMTRDKFNLVELDEDYNLQVMDYGQLFGIERFSGGEKDLANLCLRLAISLALTESAGLDRSFVILDEVFGSQDNDRRNLIFNGLASLTNRFPQILLITHIDEIKHQVETLIQVDPVSGGWSEVKVNGQAV